MRGVGIMPPCFQLMFQLKFIEFCFDVYNKVNPPRPNNFSLT